MDFHDKKVLVFGLGILGGGSATTNWLLRQGARVCVTDLKTQDQLQESLDKISEKVELRLGGHSKKDIDDHEIIVINPDVSIRNELIQYALAEGKMVLNEAIIFFQNFGKPVIAITGTRGKTTTTAWTEFFISSKFRSSIAGNSTTHPFLAILEKSSVLDTAVAEVSSYHLELADQVPLHPHIAIITNIFQDHLNRHGTLEEYARVKANIFKYQSAEDFLILNAQNPWTENLLNYKPRAKVFFFSREILDEDKEGVWAEGDKIFCRLADRTEKILSLENFNWGEHNIENILAAALAAHCAGVAWPEIQNKLADLPQVPYRQEIVHQSEKLTIVNDTTATSPEGGIAAVKRFGSSETILITGGTDKELDFSGWSEELKKNISPANLIMLSGSATEKMKRVLGGWAESVPVRDSLEDCFKVALDKSSKFKKAIILFSPASKSFEKFKNEYDRGEKFNELVKQLHPR